MIVRINTEPGIVSAVVVLERRGEEHEATVELTGTEAIDAERVAVMLRQMADKLDPSRFDAKLAEAKQALGVV